jgi:hypothetical protein
VAKHVRELDMHVRGGVSAFLHWYICLVMLSNSLLCVCAGPLGVQVAGLSLLCACVRR